MSEREMAELSAWVGALESRLSRLNRKLKATANAPAELRFASIDAGRGIVLKDESGNAVYRLGRDPRTGVVSGEYVGGPDPDAPEEPFVDVGEEQVKVQSSGLDAEGRPGPADYLRTLVFASQEPEFGPAIGVYAGSFHDISGSFTHRLPSGTWYVAVQWETRSHKLSPMSAVVEVDVPYPVNEEMIQEELDAAQERLDEARAEFEEMNRQREQEIENLNDVVLPAIEETLREKADSSALGDLDETLRQAFGEADEAIQQVADDARAKAEAAGATAAEADEAAAQAVAEAEAAFARAEAAETAASSAESSADASAQDAADALAQALAAGGDATAAQQAADAARAAADEARGHADIAGTAAAEADAKAAEAAADAAQAQADALAAAQSSTTSAEEAQAAKGRAEQAAAEAAAAYERAQEAEESASSASGAASAAELAADNAASQAADALSRAQAAEGDAGAAQKAADDAQRYADEAQAQADEANTNAANADAKAAQAAADAAQAVADAAKAAQDAEEAKAEAEAAKEYADEQDAKVAADAAADAQAKADAVRAEAQEALEFYASRGDNLIFNGSFERGGEGWRTSRGEIVQTIEARTGDHALLLGREAANDYPMSDWVATEVGRVYLVEYWAKKLPGGTTPRELRVYSQYRLADGSTPGGYARNDQGDIALAQVADLPENEWVKVSGTLEIIRPTTNGVSFGPHVLATGTKFYIDDFRVVDITEAKAALDAAKAAQAKADEAHQDAGDAWTHADAAMSRAGAAEQAAKDHADNLPKVLHGTSAPSGTAPNGSIWWQHSGSLTGPVTAQWNRVNGAWVSTPISSEAIANLDVGKLTAGGAVISDAVIQDLTAKNGAFDRLDARRGWIGGVALEDGAIGAREINTEEVFSDKVVANTLWTENLHGYAATLSRGIIAAQNLYPDPDFEDTAQYGSTWTVVNGGIEKNGGNAQQGTYYTAETIPATPGDRFNISADITWLSGSAGTVSVYARSYNASGSYIGGSATSSIRISYGDRGYNEGVYTVPNNAASITIGFFTESDMTTGTRVRVENPRVQNMTDGRLLVDGTVDARAINGESVTAEVAKFLEVEAGMIKANAFRGQTFSGGTFEGAVIRGSRIETESASNRGVKILGDGIHGYDSRGNETVRITGEIGDVRDPNAGNFLSGRFYTNGPGKPGVILNPDYGDVSSQGPGIWFSESGWVDNSQPAIWTDDNWDLWVRPKTADGNDPTTWFHGHVVAARGGGIFVGNPGDTSFRGVFSGGWGWFNGMQSNGDAEFMNRVDVHGIADFNSSAYFRTWARFPGAPETSESANAHIDRYNRLYKQRSASRYKLDQRVMDVSDDILDLDLKDWVDRTQAEELEGLRKRQKRCEVFNEEETALIESKLRRIPGVVAEDVEAVDSRFVTYGADGQVEGVRYDRLALAWLPVVRRQRDKLAEQEERIVSHENTITELREENDQLRAKVDDMEARLAKLEALLHE